MKNRSLRGRISNKVGTFISKIEKCQYLSKILKFVFLQEIEPEDNYLFISLFQTSKFNEELIEFL